MKTPITYSLATAAAILASAAFIYAGGACSTKDASSCSSKEAYTQSGTCGSTTAEECAKKCGNNCHCDASCPGTQAAQHTFSTIDTEGLKALIASGEAVVIVDARSGKYDDGRRIPGVVSLSADARDETIAQVLPDKNAKVVAYCSNEKCPASANLAKRLVKLGYTNVHKYPHGIAGWTAAGHPVTTAAAK